MPDINLFKSEAGAKAKPAIIIIGLVLLASIITVALLRDRLVNVQYRQVTVMGQGRVSYHPDLAVINLGVQIDKAKQAEEALKQLNEKVNKIIAAVQAEGIEAADISTQNYNLYPQYDYQDNISTVAGYSANEQLSIRIKDYDSHPERLNKVLAAAAKAGANQINGLSFDSSSLNTLKQQARILALRDAQAKSGELMAVTEVKIKNIAGWWENVIYPPSVTYVGGDLGKGGAADYSAATPSGNREIVIEVGVNYNIK